MRGPSTAQVHAAADRAEARAGLSEERRQGRGRLGSMDLVPEDGQDDVRWALGELDARQRSQAEILEELNERLEAKGIAPISKSAFNRRSVKLAAFTNDLAETRYLLGHLAPEFTPERVDQQTLVLGEFMKMLCFNLVQKGSNAIDTKGAQELARAYLAVIQGQKISSDRRSQLEREFARSTEKAIDTVAKEKGLTGDTVRGIKERILGLKLKPAEGAPA